MKNSAAVGASFILFSLSFLPEAALHIIWGMVEQVVNLVAAFFQLVDEPAPKEGLEELSGFPWVLGSQFHAELIAQEGVSALVGHGPQTFQVAQHMRHRLLEDVDETQKFGVVAETWPSHHR